MESFRYRSKRNDPFASFSNFKKKLSENLQSSKQNNRYGLPSFELCSIIGSKSKNNNHVNQIRNRKIGHKYTKSLHQQTNRTKGDTLTFRELRVKKKHLLTQGQSFQIFDKEKLKIKKIDKIMKQKKNNFNFTLRKTEAKLNFSYKHTLQDTLNYDFANLNQLRLSQSSNIDIKLETKSRKKLVFKNQFHFQDFNRQSTSSDQIFLKQNNLFSIELQSKKCYDSIFPMFRNGSTLASLGPQIYLFGGINSRLTDSFHFHQYLPMEKQWISVRNQQNNPNVIPSFHTVEVYKNSLVIIGGTSLGPINTTKIFNPDILIYNTENQGWSKIKWNICIRCHASTIYGNMLVVYGGIDLKGKFSHRLFFLPLNSLNILQTSPNPYNLSSQTQGIAYHKLVNTFQIDNSFKNKIKIDGVICYGGKFSNGELNSEVTLFRFNKHKEDKRQNLIKGWQTVQTYGLKPQARYCHSMNILYKKCICFIIGGLNQSDMPLNDAWILDLVSCAWTRAIFDNKYQILERSIFSHTTTVVNSEIYVFGGFSRQNKLNSEFWSIDFTYSRAARKQQQLKKSRLSITSSNKFGKQSSKMKRA